MAVYNKALPATTGSAYSVQVPVTDPATHEAVPGRFRAVTVTPDHPHSEKVWWLLAPNPFVVVADTAPRAIPLEDDPVYDALAEIRLIARDARGADRSDVMFNFQDDRRLGGPVWPYGLVVNLLLGSWALAVTVRRVRAATSSSTCTSVV